MNDDEYEVKGKGAEGKGVYPTTYENAKEARIDVNDPVFGKHLGQVCLRPVVLPELEKIVTSTTAQARRDRTYFAMQMAFGENP